MQRKPRLTGTRYFQTDASHLTADHPPATKASPMNTETSPQELLTRRQFLLQAAAVGGALATPVNLFGSGGTGCIR